MYRLLDEAERRGKLYQHIEELQETKQLAAAIKKEEKIEQCRETEAFIKRHPEDFFNVVSETLNERERQRNISQCENALAEELGSRKAHIQREEKIRQFLWENTPELRELRKKLLMAKVTRDQAKQMAEKQSLVEMHLKEKETQAEEAAREREELETLTKVKKELDFQAKLQYHKDLDEQRDFHVAKGEADVMEAMKERVLIDEIRCKIVAEDEERRIKKLESQQELLRQALEVKKAREEIREEQEKLEKGRELRDDEYRKAQELRSVEHDERRKLTAETRLQLQQELLDHLRRMYAEKERQELLRIELAIEEKEEADKEREKESTLRKLQVSKELQQIYDMQICLKQQKEELIKKQDEHLFQVAMDKLYKEDKLELLSQQRRRMKQLEHRRKVQEMMEDNRRKKALLLAREMDYHLRSQQMEKERMELIAQEKLRFLKENSKELLGYLPKGIFKDDQEIERLGEEFKKFYTKQSCGNESS